MASDLTDSEGTRLPVCSLMAPKENKTKKIRQRKWNKENGTKDHFLCVLSCVLS